MVLDFISKLTFTNQIKLLSYNKIKYMPYQTINFNLNYKYLKFIKKSISALTSIVPQNKSTYLSVNIKNFKNNNFFLYYKYFTSKSWPLVGTPMPQFKYGLSSQNIWKTDFISLDSVSTFFIKSKKSKKIKFLKKSTKTFKNQQKFFNFNWSKYQCSHNSSLRKKFLFDWKKYRFIPNSRTYHKVKKRKRSRVKLKIVRNRLKGFFTTKNNKTQYHKTLKKIKTIPIYHKKLPKNKFKRIFLLTQNNLNLKIIPKTKNNYTHLKNYKLPQSVIFKWFTLKSHNWYQKKKSKIFKRIKNQNYVNIKTKRYLRRINRKFKKNNNLKTLYSLKIKQLYKTNSQTFKKKLILLRINESNKPKLFSKFKHSKPYNFTNCKKNTNPTTYPLLDVYLTRTLQPFTTYKIRNKKTQSFSNSFKFKFDFFKKFSRQKLLNAPVQIKQSLKKTFYLKNTNRYNLKLLPNANIKLKKIPLKNTLKNKLLPLKIPNVASLSYLRKNFSQKIKIKTLNTINKISHKSQISINFSKINLSKIKINKSPKNIIKPKLITKTNYTFILKSPIIFFSKTLLNNQNKIQIPKFIFKKTIFSFVKPNEIRQSLMDRKKQFYFYKILFNQKTHYLKNTSFKPHKLKQLYLKTQNQNFKVQSLNFNNYLNTEKQINNISNSLNLTTSKDIFEFKGVNQLFQRSEVRIPRVRFKPGYQRIWRQSRTALKESLKIKFAYQKKLSRYLVKFFKKINYYAFSASEMSVERTIIYSRLVPDLSTLLIFAKQHFIYLNGKTISKLNSLVYENDLIQLIISKWYYAAYRWISNWTLKRVKRYKRLLYKKGLSSRYKLIKQRKQKSFYVPYWIYLTKYDSSDIKSYLEVDYLTLSAIIIYNPYIITHHSPAETFEYRPTVYRLYNWKYIT